MFTVANVIQSTVTVREGVDIIQTNISFLRQQFTRMATHILRCSGTCAYSMYNASVYTHVFFNLRFVSNINCLMKTE